MPDREKVLKGLESCIVPRKCEDGCPYYIEEFCFDGDMKRDAIELLKEQEDKIRQLRLALKIMNGNGIKVDTESR